MEVTVTVTTPAGARVTATVEGEAVTITQDGQWAGDGRWNGHRIDDCAARLGTADGSETDSAYEALDRALQLASR